MDRRQVVQSLGFLSAHAVFPAVLSNFISSCANKETASTSLEYFTQEEVSTIIETIDLILPTTKTKSASEVNTHLFLDQIFAKCMTPQQQEIMRSGLAQLTAGLASATDKTLYLKDLDKKAYTDDDNFTYFKSIKQYALIGFFTSQEGETRASNYIKIPEAYKGEIPATETTLNYGKTNLTYSI